MKWRPNKVQNIMGETLFGKDLWTKMVGKAEKVKGTIEIDMKGEKLG